MLSYYVVSVALRHRPTLTVLPKLGVATTATNVQTVGAASIDFPLDAFAQISFTHHMEILHHTKTVKERVFYIRLCAHQYWSKYALRNWLRQDLYHHQGTLAHNFAATIPNDRRYLHEIKMFKDEYFLDFLNSEELDLSDPQDLDGRTLDGKIIMRHVLDPPHA